MKCLPSKAAAPPAGKTAGPAKGAKPAVESLSELLAGELAELKRFCVLLDEERKVLTGAQADRLADIANEKSSLAAQIGRRESHRDAMLAKKGLPKGRPGIDAWLASLPNPEAERTRWQELLELAARARDENQTNGRLIGLLLRQNEEAISLLVSGGADSVYGNDGQTRRGSDGKRSFGTY